MHGVWLQRREERNEHGTESLSARQSSASRRQVGGRHFASCLLHCRTVAHPVSVDRFERTGNVNARSGGSARREAPITAASEFPAQGCFVACSPLQPCCPIRQYRSASTVSTSKLSVAQPAAGSDRPTADAFGYPQRARCGGGTAAALCI
jgi:hypothetical protein